MTLEQYQSRLQQVATQVANRITDAAIIPAGSTLLARIKNRIINEGKGSAGNKIGSYSTKPAYFTRSKFVKKAAFKPQGKTGKGAKKNGQARKSMYLPNGYAQLRQIQGRQSSFVNLEYSGDTMLALQMTRNGNTVQIGFTRQKASVVRKALEQRYGPVYAGTQAELREYSNEVSTVAANLTRQILTQ